MARKKKKHVCLECFEQFNHGIGLRKHQRQSGHKGSNVFNVDDSEYARDLQQFCVEEAARERAEPVVWSNVRPQLKAPYGVFLRVMAIVFLAALVQQLSVYLPKHEAWETATQQRELREVVSPTLRLVHSPKSTYLVRNRVSDGQESMLQLLLEPSGEEVTTIIVRPTWPEYLGYALWLCFGVCVLRFLLTCLKGRGRGTGYDTSGILLMASVFGSYFLAAWLGWVWHEPIVFGKMYFTLLAFAVYKEKTLSTKAAN